MSGEIPTVSRLLAAISGVPHACEPVPGLVTGGQPTAEHLAALKAAGCEVVLDGRDPMEPRPFPDEEAAVLAVGLEYVNVPLSYTPPDDAPLPRLRELLAPVARGRRTLLHCNSGNRIGAALIPYLVLDRGIPEGDAVALAIRIGARDPGLIEWAVSYARREGGPTPGADTSASR
jgi:protein tyrosine phosphatase (PTP) superfamily phosphohydrolase (DUF442 family)